MLNESIRLNGSKLRARTFALQPHRTRRRLKGAVDLLNVRYLYAVRGGFLYQPVYTGSREGEDLGKADNIATLKYKQDGLEDAS